MKAQAIIMGLGGAANIVTVDNCMSRLRVGVSDMSLVDDQLLKSTGCLGIVKPDDVNIQIIYGTTVGMIREAVNKELKKNK
jgi:PTS system maltose and glucose-specific IIC component